MTGKQLSHYLIESELGRGGMGVVYRARDTKLDRTVAIKVLPSAALASDDDRARFHREAKAAAQLHHPNIAAVFEIDEAVTEDAPHNTQPSPFIAMEFIEGETIQGRIDKGPLKLDDAVRIASEIADGLQAAHNKNIVHRDIKSANVMIGADGRAKILDFGLAQTSASTKLTRMGSTLGTIAYMSPEQARGEEVDARTDIWSLGVMLYEMVTGRHPFPGDYEQAAVYSILNENPEPPTAIRTGVPMELEWLINKCLAKDASARYQNAGDLLVDLKAVDVQKVSVARSIHQSQQFSRAADTIPQGTQSDHAIPVLASLKSKVPMILVVLLVGFLGGYAIHGLLQEPEIQPDAPIMKLELPLLPGQLLWALDISPDGRFVVYLTDSGNGSMFRYDLETGEVRSIDGTFQATRISVSDDGQWAMLGSRYSIARIPTGGGSALPIVSTSEYASASWSPDGQSVFYTSANGLISKSLTSGAEQMLTQLDSLRGETAHSDGSLLPDNRTLMFSISSSSVAAIGFVDTETGERVGEIPGGVEPTYVESGHILYVDENSNLIAVPFDLRTLEPLSAPVAVLQTTDRNGWAVSDAGTLVSSGVRGLLKNERPLVRTSVSGVEDSLEFGDSNHDNMRLSPDGKILAVQIGLTQDRDVWIYDLESGSRIPLTVDGRSYSPSWSSDGKRVVYVSGTSTIVEVPVDGSTSARVVFQGTGTIDYPSWSDDGSMLTFDMDGDIWLFDEENGARVFMETPTLENQPRFSPNGKFLALTRVNNGTPHIFVHEVDDPNNSWDTSQGMGLDPYWSANGDIVYYRSGTDVMMRHVATEPAFRPLRNPEVFIAFDHIVLDYAILPGGTGIIEAIALRQEDRGTTRLDVIVNFFELLKKMAPTGQ